MSARRSKFLRSWIGARSLTGWQFHPFANVFPLMEGAEFEALVSDIRENGIVEPIEICDGKILDGRNRYLASLEAGIHCPSRQFNGIDPLAHVISLNLRRRHLDESQRAMVAAKLATLGQGARTDLAPIEAMSQSDAADMLNVGRRFHSAC